MRVGGRTLIGAGPRVGLIAEGERGRGERLKRGGEIGERNTGGRGERGRLKLREPDASYIQIVQR